MFKNEKYQKHDERKEIYTTKVIKNNYLYIMIFINRKLIVLIIGEEIIIFYSKKNYNRSFIFQIYDNYFYNFFGSIYVILDFQ